MGCDISLLHWERGSGPSERRSNEGMCELLTKDACVLHVVHVVPRPVPGCPWCHNNVLRVLHDVPHVVLGAAQCVAGVGRVVRVLAH